MNGNPTHADMTPDGSQIVVYQPNETVRLDVRLENETVWLNQARLGQLFGIDRTVVNRHIHNIYKTGELDETATCAKIAQVQIEGGRSISRTIPFYSLDMIIAAGYRVNSLQKGDVLIFYRTGGYYKGVVSTIGIMVDIQQHFEKEEDIMSVVDAEDSIGARTRL